MQPADGGLGLRRHIGIWGPAAIAVAGFAAYANTFSCPLLFDDHGSITDNPTILHLWPPWAALSPPHGQGMTVDGRPILNFSLAVNHAISGEKVWSYHLLNLLIHIGAGLALFGIVRRTLLRWSALSPMRFSAMQTANAGNPPGMGFAPSPGTPAQQRIEANALHLGIATVSCPASSSHPPLPAAKSSWANWASLSRSFRPK